MTAAERAVEHARRVRRGRSWLGIWAILVAGSGLVELAEEKATADVVFERAELRARETGSPSSKVALSALQQRLGQRQLRVLGKNVGLAALFGALWLWARSAPVAALASAIAVFLGTWIAAGVINRETLLDFYVVRVAALVIFAAALRAAIAARGSAEVH